MNKWITILLILVLSGGWGCATTTATVKEDLSPPSSQTAVSPGPATPLQALASLITKLADNPIFTAANKDAADTLVWLKGPEAPTDPLQQFRAQQCPIAVQLATADFKAKANSLVSILNDLDSRLKAPAPGGPEIILHFTKLRYGTGPKLDPVAQFNQIKADVFNRVSAVVDSCRAIIPVRQLDELAVSAVKIGGLAFGIPLP